jgi:hypothetical protein
MMVACAIRLALESLLNAVCFVAVNSLISATLVIGEVERCVMQMVVAPLRCALPSASVTSRLEPVWEMPRATCHRRRARLPHARA